ncbi:MAG: SagB/ThcOx family dehydrogenase, partial [Candidatus Lokiarchaeota archaeon]|nr:SagB/ThcOx family dehydrogenase [Candidatus Lokiarchaeota archaeon]
MDIKLFEPKLKGSKSLEECIFERVSVRSFKDKKIEIEKISQILWAGQGKKGFKKTVPSAGGTYPLELYVIIKDKGIYHYNSNKNLLDLKRKGDFGKDLANASLNQMFIYEAPINIIICADLDRTCDHYGKRGVRYVYMEIGHCAQNIELEAVALGLTSVPIGAFHDEEVKKVLDL